MKNTLLKFSNFTTEHLCSVQHTFIYYYIQLVRCSTFVIAAIVFVGRCLYYIFFFIIRTTYMVCIVDILPSAVSRLNLLSGRSPPGLTSRRWCPRYLAFETAPADDVRGRAEEIYCSPEVKTRTARQRVVFRTAV